MADEKGAGSADDLIAKLKAALGGGGTREDDDDGDEPRGGKVPYDRFQAVSRERAQLKRQLGEALSLVERERATAAKAIEDLKSATAKEVSALAAQYDERLQARDLGFDEDGVTALRAAYSRLPEKGRPASAIDWWKTATADEEGRKALPRTLLAYLPPDTHDGAAWAGDRGKPADRAPQKKTSIDAGAKPAAGAKAKADAIANAGSMAELSKLLRGG